MNIRAPRFLTGARKGENHELRADLNSEYRDRVKDAIQRTIANMTVGKDVSGLFPDVLKNMQTDDLEQKKLVYLYLMNYAKSQPELVILAVNTFVKDASDSNPLIRALAIRTMGCLRVEKIVDYLCEPLRQCLKDENPYVRKTAAICVAKLYDLKPELALDNGFVDQLKDMVSDNNPMVVSNAVTALSEISTVAAQQNPPIFVLDSALLSKLLVALGECTEWGRIAILGAVSKYKTEDEKEAEHICERVIPQFQHANGSVVLAAIRVIMIHMRSIQNEVFIKGLLRKMGPPLVTLVSAVPEVQWVALRNINLILQKRPDALANEMRVFFCKYNDPPYCKVEKLEIMIKLANERNADTLLSELREYASEVDVDFVRRSIRAIGQCAIKIEGSSEKCVNVLLDLIATGVSYVVQESIVVIKDIFRRYPHKYEGIIPTLCASLEELDEPEAKASLIWILGEYAEKIDNADELIETFLENFLDDPVQVQIQTLTAVVKLFLKKPDNAQALVQRVLQMATKSCDSADVRDRAYIYWRLLSTDSDAAKSVVLSERPLISIPPSSVSPQLLDELIGEISSLASVYHRPVETFLGRGRLGADEVQRKRLDQEEESIATKAIETLAAGQKAENLLDFDEPVEDATPGLGVGGSNAPVSVGNPLDDLLGIFDSTNLGGGGGGAGNVFGGMGGMGGFGMQPPASQPMQGQNGFGGMGGMSFGQPQAQNQFGAMGMASPPLQQQQPNGTGVNGQNKQADLLDGLF
ncbi:Adaptor protein complex beta subunit [Atractiella rhizophila]|nr:Adaptor protein complex beta subunit [Atractiella rhizophila]